MSHVPAAGRLPRGRLGAQQRRRRPGPRGPRRGRPPPVSVAILAPALRDARLRVAARTIGPEGKRRACAEGSGRAARGYGAPRGTWECDGPRGAAGARVSVRASAPTPLLALTPRLRGHGSTASTAFPAVFPSRFPTSPSPRVHFLRLLSSVPVLPAVLEKCLFKVQTWGWGLGGRPGVSSSSGGHFFFFLVILSFPSISRCPCFLISARDGT